MIYHGFTAKGHFAAVDTLARVSSYAYAGSQYANAAREDAERVASAMLDMAKRRGGSPGLQERQFRMTCETLGAPYARTPAELARERELTAKGSA